MANVKVLNKDPFTYAEERRRFLEDLQRFHNTRGTPFDRIPQIGGTEIDLYRLYRNVTDLGGFQKVNADLLWEDIQEDFSVPVACANGAQALKYIYFRYLNIYEKVHFLGLDPENPTDEPEDGPARKKVCLPVESIPLTYNYNQHKVQDNQREASHLSTDLARFSDYNKLEMSLRSGLANEVDFAVNVCLLLSTEGRYVLKLNRSHHLLPLLLANIGIFEEGPGTMEDILIHSWTNTESKRDFLRFWHDVVNDENIRENIMTKNGIYKRDELVGNEVLHLGRDLGVRDAEGQRVLQLATLIRNLSFEDVNQQLLASSSLVFRFLMLCVHSSYGSLRQLALDTLGNLAAQMVLQPVETTTTQLIMNLIKKSLLEQDKFVIVRALEMLSKLCQLEKNETILNESLEGETYSRIVQLLTVHDIQLIVHTLEALYQLSELGETTTTMIANVKQAVDMLVNLITVEAQSYGPNSLVGIKVVEYVPPADPSATPSSAHVQQPPRTVIQSMAPGQAPGFPVPPSHMSAADQARSDVETTASNWLQGTYETKKGSCIKQADMFADYQQFCCKFGIADMLTAADLVCIVKSAIPQVKISEVEKGEGPKETVMKGLSKRAKPKPFAILAGSDKVYKPPACNVPVNSPRGPGPANWLNSDPLVVPAPTFTPTLRQRLMEPPQTPPLQQPLVNYAGATSAGAPPSARPGGRGQQGLSGKSSAGGTKKRLIASAPTAQPSGPGPGPGLVSTPPRPALIHHQQLQVAGAPQTAASVLQPSGGEQVLIQSSSSPLLKPSSVLPAVLTPGGSSTFSSTSLTISAPSNVTMASSTSPGQQFPMIHQALQGDAAVGAGKVCVGLGDQGNDTGFIKSLLAKKVCQNMVRQGNTTPSQSPPPPESHLDSTVAAISEQSHVLAQQDHQQFSQPTPLPTEPQQSRSQQVQQQPSPHQQQQVIPLHQVDQSTVAAQNQHHHQQLVQTLPASQVMESPSTQQQMVQTSVALQQQQQQQQQQQLQQQLQQGVHHSVIHQPVQTSAVQPERVVPPSAVQQELQPVVQPGASPPTEQQSHVNQQSVPQLVPPPVVQQQLPQSVHQPLLVQQQHTAAPQQSVQSQSVQSQLLLHQQSVQSQMAPQQSVQSHLVQQQQLVQSQLAQLQQPAVQSQMVSQEQNVQTQVQPRHMQQLQEIQQQPAGFHSQPQLHQQPSVPSSHQQQQFSQHTQSQGIQVQTQGIQTQPFQTQGIQAQPQQTQGIQVQTQGIPVQPQQSQGIQAQLQQSQIIQSQQQQSQGIQNQPQQSQGIQTQLQHPQGIQALPQQSQGIQTQPQQSQGIQTQPPHSQLQGIQAQLQQSQETQTQQSQGIQTQPPMQQVLHVQHGQVVVHQQAGQPQQQIQIQQKIPGQQQMVQLQPQQIMLQGNTPQQVHVKPGQQQIILQQQQNHVVIQRPPTLQQILHQPVQQLHIQPAQQLHIQGQGQGQMHIQGQNQPLRIQTQSPQPVVIQLPMYQLPQITTSQMAPVCASSLPSTLVQSTAGGLPQSTMMPYRTIVPHQPASVVAALTSQRPLVPGSGSNVMQASGNTPPDQDSEEARALRGCVTSLSSFGVSESQSVTVQSSGGSDSHPNVCNAPSQPTDNAVSEGRTVTPGPTPSIPSAAAVHTLWPSGLPPCKAPTISLSSCSTSSTLVPHPAAAASSSHLSSSHASLSSNQPVSMVLSSSMSITQAILSGQEVHRTGSNPPHSIRLSTESHLHPVKDNGHLNGSSSVGVTKKECNGLGEVNGGLGSPDSASNDLPPSPVEGVRSQEHIPNGLLEGSGSSLKEGGQLSKELLYNIAEKMGKVNGVIHHLENGGVKINTSQHMDIDQDSQLSHTGETVRMDSVEMEVDTNKKQEVWHVNGLSSHGTTSTKENHVAQPPVSLHSKPGGPLLVKQTSVEEVSLDSTDSRLVVNCSKAGEVGARPLFSPNSSHDSDVSCDSFASSLADSVSSDKHSSQGPHFFPRPSSSTAPSPSPSSSSCSTVFPEVPLVLAGTIPKSEAINKRNKKKATPKPKVEKPPSKSKKRKGGKNAVPETPAPPVPARPLIMEYMCEWAGCGRCFDSARLVYLHAAKTHVPSVPEAVCHWQGCEPLRRKRWSLVTHLQDHHCSEGAQRAGCQRRFQAAQTAAAGSSPQPPTPLQQAPALVYPHDAAMQAIKRFHIKPPFAEFADQREGPVTKHIRLTAALILRNLSRYSAMGRSLIKQKERQLSYVTMSACESSTALSSCLWEILHDK